eukprot:SAG31_NODE_93_length_26250_cov_47.615082_9_plen_77_part_00
MPPVAVAAAAEDSFRMFNGLVGECGRRFAFDRGSLVAAHALPTNRFKFILNLVVDSSQDADVNLVNLNLDLASYYM